jgi:hypothetical protein
MVIYSEYSIYIEERRVPRRVPEKMREKKKKKNLRKKKKSEKKTAEKYIFYNILIYNIFSIS